MRRHVPCIDMYIYVHVHMCSCLNTCLCTFMHTYLCTSPNASRDQLTTIAAFIPARLPSVGLDGWLVLSHWLLPSVESCIARVFCIYIFPLDPPAHPQSFGDSVTADLGSVTLFVFFPFRTAAEVPTRYMVIVVRKKTGLPYVFRSTVGSIFLRPPPPPPHACAARPHA